VVRALIKRCAVLFAQVPTARPHQSQGVPHQQVPAARGRGGGRDRERSERDADPGVTHSPPWKLIPVYIRLCWQGGACAVVDAPPCTMHLTCAIICAELPAGGCHRARCRRAIVRLHHGGRADGAGGEGLPQILTFIRAPVQTAWQIHVDIDFGTDTQGQKEVQEPRQAGDYLGEAGLLIKNAPLHRYEVRSPKCTVSPYKHSIYTLHLHAQSLQDLPHLHSGHLTGRGGGYK
jgi:hypothetical protein